VQSVYWYRITIWPTGYTTDSECSIATRFGYLQVRPGPIISAAQRSALAWRSRTYQLQAERYCASLLAGESSEVLGRLLHTSFGSRRPSTTTRSQSTTPYSPRYWLRAFLVAGPNSWNYLPDRLRDQALSPDSLMKLLTMEIFISYKTHTTLYNSTVYSVARKVSKLRIIIKSYWKHVNEARLFHQIWVKTNHHKIVSWY